MFKSVDYRLLQFVYCISHIYSKEIIETISKIHANNDSDEVYLNKNFISEFCIQNEHNTKVYAPKSILSIDQYKQVKNTPGHIIHGLNNICYFTATVIEDLICSDIGIPLTKADKDFLYKNILTNFYPEKKHTTLILNENSIFYDLFLDVVNKPNLESILEFLKKILCYFYDDIVIEFLNSNHITLSCRIVDLFDIETDMADLFSTIKSVTEHSINHILSSSYNSCMLVDIEIDKKALHKMYKDFSGNYIKISTFSDKYFSTKNPTTTLEYEFESFYNEPVFKKDLYAEFYSATASKNFKKVSTEGIKSKSIW